MDEQVETFKYELRQEVVIAASGEEGIVIGRAEYVTSEPGYLIRYKAGDGRATESWWTETALHKRLGERPAQA